MKTEAQVGRRPPFVGLLALAALAYYILVGGTLVGEILPAFRIANALIGGALIAYYLWRAPREGDSLDGWIALAAATFALAGTISPYPRQAFDGRDIGPRDAHDPRQVAACCPDMVERNRHGRSSP
jgi:hypothetical protein